VVRARPQILSQGHEVDVDGPKILKRGFELGIGLSEPQHDRTLGDQGRGCEAPCGPEDVERAVVARTRVAHLGAQRADRLEVMREDIRRTFKEGFDRPLPSPQVPDEKLDQSLRGGPPDTTNGLR